MKCHIPGINVKILGRAIHAMAKIGDELYLESVDEGLILRTINSSESAYCMVIFKRSFFTYYDCNYFNTDEEQGLKCKISMKSALKVFKSPGHMDKQVELCEIKFDLDASNLIFQLRCKQGVVKTHRLFILDCKTMEASYTKEAVPNRLTVFHKVLSEAVSNFQISEDQVTFEVTPKEFLFRNYADSNDTTKIIRSQMSLNPVEFETFCITKSTIITFSMKEFKAVLTFAEALNIPIAVHFETTGKPVVFILNNGTTFELNFVLATEREFSGTQLTEIPVNEKKKITTSTATKRQNKSMPRSENSRANKKPHLDNANDVSNCLDEDSHLFNFIEMPDDSFSEPKNSLNLPNPPEKSVNGFKIDSKLCDLDNLENINENDVIINDCNDEIPGSPINNTQIRNTRNIFKRCFEATFDPSRFFGTNVLAEDSDCDD